MENTKIYYKGRGEHSVKTLETIIEQLEEELHLIRSGQSTLPSTEERKTAEDIKTDFYRRFGAGDFQNDTDLLYVDKAWEWFYKQTEAMAKELSEAKKEIEELKKEMGLRDNSFVELSNKYDDAQSGVEKTSLVNFPNGFKISFIKNDFMATDGNAVLALSTNDFKAIESLNPTKQD